MNYRARPISLSLSMVSVFAVLNVVGDSVPLTPVIGFAQSRLSLGWILAPLTGLMLGPYTGSLSCFLASLVELFLGFPIMVPFGPFGLVRSALAAFQTGMVSTHRWIISAGALSLLILGWLMTIQGQEAVSVLVFHIFGLTLILASGRQIATELESQDRVRIGLAVGIATYCGSITRHLFGNLLFVLFASLPSAVFSSAIPLTLLEQTFFAVVSSILGASLVLLGLRRVTYLG